MEPKNTTARSAGPLIKAIMKHTNPNSGFTLLELMLTVTIAGILLVIGIPSFNYTILSNRVKTAASDFHINLLLARSEAIKLNRNVDINWTSNGWDISYMTEDPTPVKKIIRSYVDLSPDVSTLCDVNGDNSADTCPDPITINRNGRLTNPPYSRWFYTTKSTSVSMRCVSITLSGVPRVDTDTDSDPTNGC